MASETEQEESFDDIDWKVGNVYDDLDRLKREIAIANADQHLRQVEDRERLDTFAAQRRPIQNDFRKYVLAPLALALLLTRMAQSQRTQRLAHVFMRYSDAHYWLVMVVAPIVVLFAKRWSSPPPPPLPTELRGLDPDYYRFIVTDWENPKTSCRDHVLCLLELWTSAVLGTAVGSCLQRWIPIPSTYSFVTFAAVAQWVTRLGAIASLHQYPKLLYQLRRRHQPRPMDRYTLRFRQLTWMALAFAPLGVACDMAKVMLRLSPILVFSVTSIGMSSYVKHQLLQDKKPRPLFRAVLQTMSRIALTVAQITAILQVVLLLRGYIPTTFPSVSNISKYNVLRYIILSLSVISPLCHLAAVRKLFRVNYTHDLSLASDYNTISTILSDPIELEKRLTWRYRLIWREPERLSYTLSQWQGGFSYWWLFAGGVQDKLRKEFLSNQQGEAYQRGLTVLQRCDDEQRLFPDAPAPKSHQWKSKAMEKIAAKHQRDYERKKYDDPLGVAVQQTFGIGLGYNFDHMSTLKEGESLSARRLQARAAKSAIRRAQEIYDASDAREKLDSIRDPKKRKRKGLEMRQAADTEMEYLARALSDLIPTNSILDVTRQTKVQQFVKRDYKRTSSHEILVSSPSDDSTSLNALLGKDEEKHDDDDDQSDEEFVEAWMKRQRDDDNGNSTVLV